MKIFIHILILLFSASITETFGQEQLNLDSLRSIYHLEPDRQKDHLLLSQIANAEKNPDSMLKFSRMVLENEEESNPVAQQQAFLAQGVAWRIKGNFDRSLQYLFKSAELAQELENWEELGVANVEIANTYSENEDFHRSVVYYRRGAQEFERLKDTLRTGLTFYNMGDDLYDKGELDSALVYTQKAREIFQQTEKRFYEGYALGNLGRIYARQKDYEIAESYLTQAIDIVTDDYNALTDFFATLSEIYAERNRYTQAIQYAQQSLKAAQIPGLKNDIKQAHLNLSHLYEKTGNHARALQHYKDHVVYSDSIRNLAVVQEMADLYTDFELARKQTQVDLLNEKTRNQRNISIATGIALILILLLALGLFRRNKYIGRTKKIIEREKNRSDELLLNILPQETAMELKENGKVQAKRFDAVTILFTDFQNFTHYAESLPPEDLVKSVDFYFSKFDEIVEQHGLEKIKTVGDAYMCAAGVPFPVEGHAEKILAAACDMVAFVKETRSQDIVDETRFDIRIGVNSGPVVAGVVGNKKWAYDIWGDAVNIAARMETCSVSGKINISENTYQLIKDEFECEYRGEIMVKNKGMMKMYFVIGRKSMTHNNVA